MFGLVCALYLVAIIASRFSFHSEQQITQIPTGELMLFVKYSSWLATLTSCLSKIIPGGAGLRVCVFGVATGFLSRGTVAEFNIQYGLLYDFTDSVAYYSLCVICGCCWSV